MKFLSFLLVLALVAVVCVLATGILTFARGGEANRRWSNRLMNLRVATQFVVVVLIGLILLIHRH
jgi:uncharacterized membrane-anchored protein